MKANIYNSIRWILVPVAAVVAFAVFYGLDYLYYKYCNVSYSLHITYEVTPMKFIISKLLCSALAGFGFVRYGTTTAPFHKRGTSKTLAAIMFLACAFGAFWFSKHGATWMDYLGVALIALFAVFAAEAATQRQR